MRADLFDVGLVFVIVDLTLLPHYLPESYKSSSCRDSKPRKTQTHIHRDRNKYTVKVHSLLKFSLREANLTHTHIHRTSRKENRLLPLHVSLSLSAVVFSKSHHVNVLLTPSFSLCLVETFSSLRVASECIIPSFVPLPYTGSVSQEFKRKNNLYLKTRHTLGKRRTKAAPNTLILQTDTCSASWNSISGTRTLIQETEPDWEKLLRA